MSDYSNADLLGESRKARRASRRTLGLSEPFRDIGLRRFGSAEDFPETRCPASHETLLKSLDAHGHGG
jgi:hypothetical protein